MDVIRFEEKRSTAGEGIHRQYNPVVLDYVEAEHEVCAVGGLRVGLHHSTGVFIHNCENGNFASWHIVTNIQVAPAMVLS